MEYSLIQIIFPLPAPSRQVDASQELIALGSCQILGSFFGSMPVTASFGRSAVNAASGARTTFNGIVTGLIILVACAVLTPHFAYIPTASLAAVIISSMIFTIEVEILLPLWRAKSNYQLLKSKQREQLLILSKYFFVA